MLWRLVYDIQTCGLYSFASATSTHCFWDVQNKISLQLQCVVAMYLSQEPVMVKIDSE